MKNKIPFVSLAVFVIVLLLHSFASSPVTSPNEALANLQKSFHISIDQVASNIQLYSEKATHLDQS